MGSTQSHPQPTSSLSQEWKGLLAQYSEDHREPKLISRFERLLVSRELPDSLRALAWMTLSGAQRAMDANPGVFGMCLETDTLRADRRIARDLARTFPDEPFFKHGARGRDALSNVLSAYAAYNPRIGYCQGMNFVAGFALMYLSEEEAFWLLVRLLGGALHLAGLYSKRSRELPRFLHWIHEGIRRHAPALGRHLAKEGIVSPMDHALYAVSWATTLFSSDAPLATVARMWDALLVARTSIAIARAVVGVLARAEDTLCALPFDQLIGAMQQTVRDAPAGLLVECALSHDLLPDRWLVKCNQDFDRLHTDPTIPSSTDKHAHKPP